MSIRGAQVQTLKDFRGGRVTSVNLTGMSPLNALIAKNVLLLGDGNVRRRRGYTLVQNIGQRIARLFDFQRQSDQVQYLVAQYGTILALLKTDGSVAPTILSSNEVADKAYAFATSPYGLYGSNGAKSFAMYNVRGVESVRSWGLEAPATAPMISIQPGTLSLTYGRQYVVCDVIKWTDSKGVERYHISNASPISPHTGPLDSKLVVLAGLTPSTNPAVTHKWIFATIDNEADTTSVFLFAAEIPNAQTSWGDSLSDDQLDDSRVAPFDNYPAPKAHWLLEYEGRIVALGIPNDPDSVYASGLEEVDLGVPQESWPTALRFRVPGGIKQITGGAVFDQSLMIGTPDFWFQVRGYSADTFTKRDRIVAPGPVGFQAVVVAENMLIWLGKDKKLRAWDGNSLPLDISSKLAVKIPGLLAIEDIADDQLANAALKVFSFGRYHFLVLAVSTQSGSDTYDWFQVWDATAFLNANDGSTIGLAESDMLPSDPIVAIANVLVGDSQFLFLGDSAGNIYRWPDGFTDNGKQIDAEYGTPWLDGEAAGAVKKFLFADLSTDRQDAKDAFTIEAVASDGVNMNAELVPVPLTFKPAPYGVDPTMTRARLQQRGTAIGQWIRFVIHWPEDDQEAVLSQIELSSQPLSQVLP